MLAFRLFLALALVLVGAYTGVVISRHGMDFPAVYGGDIARFGWAGQFNLDFLFVLLMVALWVAWRHRFSAGGLALAGFARGADFVAYTQAQRFGLAPHSHPSR